MPYHSSLSSVIGNSPYTLARGMVDRVGHRRGHSDNADFAHALGAQFIDNVVVLLNEDHFDIPQSALTGMWYSARL